MNVPYDHEALWLKAKLFVNRAMDGVGQESSFSERALWATVALELLAKAALARSSPLLIAVPTEDGKNLLIASGLMQGEARFHSVTAKTLYERCSHAFKPFSLQEAMKMTHARNEYLHGSTPHFTSIPETAWWPRYWALANVLVVANEMDLEALVGYQRLDEVEAHLRQNKKNIEDRTAMLIEAAKRRLSQFQQGTLPAKEAAKWSPGAPRDAGLTYSEPETCPACQSTGSLEGDDVEDVDVSYERSADDYFTVVTVTVYAVYFSCTSCGLILDSPDLIEQAGLRQRFDAEGSDYLLAQHEADDYGND